MAEKRRMQLHLGKCIEDLDALYNVPDLKSKRATLLCKTAQKLFEKAEEAREKGDEEYSYVYYMKYLRVVAFLGKDPEYQKDKAYFINMLGVKNPNKAIDAAEKLKKSLIDRYAMERKETHVSQKDDKKKMSALAIPTDAAVAQSNLGPMTGLATLDEVVIRSEQLYPLLKAGEVRVMILDVRPGKDFVESHINNPRCISVPEECISPGQSAHVLELNLPMNSRTVWAERANMELIVMLDWNSNSVIPGKKLFLLKTILLKWDVKVQYARNPLALHGGYEDWLLKYPSLTTNPQVIPPGQMELIDDMLGDIEYPNWSDVVPPTSATEPPATAVQPKKTNEPFVDRSSKAAAIQKYEERARNMQLILEQQQMIADTSLTLEMKRIEAEKNWKEIRDQRDAEARDELQAQYQLREQEINSQLMQLESKQYDVEQENQQLREQLEEYQKRDIDEAEKLAETLTAAAELGTEAEREQMLLDHAASARELAAKRARIAEVNEQKQLLDRQREVMETERKRKLADAREKKKPVFDKDVDGDTYMSTAQSMPTSSLNRSASSPNIKPRLYEEEPNLPVVDRSTKPTNVAPSTDFHQRDFEPIWDNVGRGLTGLRNLGNTCYMNSIIQCLNNTVVLVPYFSSEQYLQHINRSHSTRGMIAEELAAVVRALWSGDYRFITAKDLRRELGKHHRAFRGCDQQDSHEFLTILMDWLHHDLQFHVNVRIKGSMSPSEIAWHEFTRSRESLILRLFYGQIKSTVRCTVCRKESVTYESFSNLSLELPAHANRCTLSDCLKLYLKGETIHGWNCPNCNKKRNAVKKLDISKLPPILVIHFKRFFVEVKDCPKTSYIKRLTYIDFPLTDLDMRPFSLHCPANHIYDLYAVSEHYGLIESGHYTSACKSHIFGKWYKYDDHLVTEMSTSDVNSSAAYILFYTSCRSV